MSAPRALLSSRHSETLLQLAAPEIGNSQGTTIEVLPDPLFSSHELEQRGPQSPAQVITALGPIETTEGEATLEEARGIHVDAESGQRVDTTRGELIGLALAPGSNCEPAERIKAVTKRTPIVPARWS